MADTKLSALTEATTLGDTDELYVNDSSTSKRITVGNFRTVMGIDADVDNTHMQAGGARFLTFAHTQFTTTAAIAAGDYRMGIAYIPAMTPDTVKIEITASAATSNLYVVVYEISSVDGLPGAKVADWGTLDATATGEPSVTGQTTSVDAGWYYVGAFAPTGNGGSPTYRAWDYRYQPSLFGEDNAGTGGGAVKGTSSDSTPSSDLSSVSGWDVDNLNVRAPKVEVA